MKIIRKKGFSSRVLHIILFMLIVFVSTPFTGGCMSIIDEKDSSVI